MSKVSLLLHLKMYLKTVFHETQLALPVPFFFNERTKFCRCSDASKKNTCR